MLEASGIIYMLSASFLTHANALGNEFDLVKVRTLDGWFRGRWEEMSALCGVAGETQDRADSLSSLTM